MVRSVTKKYQIWLAGFYDDFNGARAIPDYLQLPSDTSYSITVSHFGNPMNGEASLNPRYRFSIADRKLMSNTPHVSGVTSANQYLRNNGVFEWLSRDVKRNSFDEWEGRVQLQYPDGHVANRYRFGGSTAEGDVGYQRFVNGHNTASSYIVPVGANDATMGRADMKRFDATNYAAENAGFISTTGDFVQRAHLTGSWMGEKLLQTTSVTPSKVFAEVTSPAKKPFLCVQTVRKANDSSSIIPAIIYDGHLNSRLERDTFTARIALRSFIAEGSNDWTKVGIQFEIGFAATQAGLLNDTGYTGTPEIDFLLDLNATNEPQYDTLGLLYDGSTAQTYTNDDTWLDIDFVMKYATGKYDVYLNGTRIKTDLALASGTSVVPANLYGFQITTNTRESSVGNFGYVSYLMLDRVGMVRCLTDDITTTDEVQIKSLRNSRGVNSLSTCNVTITDDADRAANGNTGLVATDYVENLKDLFVTTSPLDWELLVFSDMNSRIDRPVWRGVVNSFKINQSKRSREIQFTASDGLRFLDNQVPLWEIGQEGLNDNLGETPYWLYDAQGFKEIMNLGATKLKLTGSDVGFEKSSNYIETSTQRMQTNSGLPIQMYNNENPIYGPNDIEDYYEGIGILGFQKDASGNTLVHLSSSTHEVTTSTAVDITSTNHNATSITPTAVSGATLTFASGDLTFSAESAKIIYIGKYENLNSADYDTWINYTPSTLGIGNGTNTLIMTNLLQQHVNSWALFKNTHVTYSDLLPPVGPHYMNVYYDADPSLEVGDYFYINKEAMDNSTALSSDYVGRHKVKSVNKILGYFNNYNTNTPTINTSNFTLNWSVTPIWVVQTFTSYPSSLTEHGKYVGESTLNGAVSVGASSITLTDASGFGASGSGVISRSELRHQFWIVDDFTWTGKSGNTLTGVSGITNAHADGVSVFNTFSTAQDDLLINNERFQWSKDIGRVKGTFVTTHGSTLKHRAIQARWMRDLPLSLWFKYQFGIVKKDPVNNTITGVANQYGLIHQGADQTLNSSTTSIRVTQTTYDSAPVSGVAELWKAPTTPLITASDNVYQEKFIYTGKQTTGGIYYLTGVKFITGSYTTSDASTSPPYYYLKFQDYKDDYKHIWLLWADMRNNGQANADGELRKQSFGLQYPLRDNYELQMYFADQFDENGNVDKFGSLNIGEDIHIWNMDATNDPLTNGAFSKPADYSSGVVVTSLADDSGKLKILTSETGTVAVGDYIHLTGSLNHDGMHRVATGGLSNDTHFITETTFVSTTLNTGGGKYYITTGSDKDLSVYQDWEDKGGSFLVIDASPFFNLNTNANGGKTGQTSGGRTDLTDYVQEREGFPALIDNYWAEALPSYRTTGDITLEHPAQYRLLSDVSLASDGLKNGDKGIPIDDPSEFGDSGVGKIIVRLEQTDTPDPEYLFLWNNKLDTKYTSPAAVSSVAALVGEGTQITAPSGADHITDGLKAGMLIKKITGGVYTRQYIKEVVSETVLKVSGTWVVGDTYEVPPQLGKVYITPAEDITVTAATDLTSLEQQVRDSFATTSQSWDDYGVTMSDSEEEKQVEVHSTVHSAFMLRLLMHLKGNIENKNSGTFWESDKFKTLWNAAIMDTWLPPTTVRNIYDINNIPITSNMTTYNSTTSSDSYGSIVDSRGSTFLSTIKKIHNNSGIGTKNNLNTTFSYLVGKDNRFEFRPKYNSNISFTRNNITMNNMAANISSQVTNVRVYYNNGQSFVDYPATNLTDTTRWKILQFPKVTQSFEATVLAKKEYDNYKKSPLKINVSPILDGNYKMIETGRHGYIADAYVALEGTDDDYTKVCNWTRLGTGGALFNGMVNALDGNQKTSTDLYARYGISKDVTTSGDIPWADNYYWYGSGSISNAVQIVHIPNGTPLVSDNHTHPMRIWVDVKNQTGTSIDDAEFTIHVADYSFSGNTRAATSQSAASVNVKHSGFYELALPSTYSDTSVGKMVVSFNAEYCRALLRHRCGDPSQTAHGTANYILDSSVDNGSGSVNANSIFPLGMREYSEMGGGFKTTRAEWYAPKILITRDLSYTPATYVTMTDAGLGMATAETMVIQKVEWSVSAGKTEDVKLTLERNESIGAQGIIARLYAQNSDDLQVGQDLGQQSGTGSVIGGNDDFPVIGNPPNEVIDDNDQKTKDGTDDSNADASFSRGRPSPRLNKGNRMSMQNDFLSANSKFSILGQEQIPTTPSSMRSIEGMDVEITPISGSAVVTSEGYIFASKGLQDTDNSSITNQEVSIETSFVVPSDIMNNILSIQASLSNGGTIDSNSLVVLYVTAECLETGTSITNTVSVAGGIEKKTVSLMPTTILSGLDTVGNNIKVTITRKPNVGNDKSTSSLVLHNLEVNMRRAAANTKSTSSQFSTIT